MHIIGGLIIFGYLKPYKNELKLKNIQEYNSLYCVLCYGLRKNFGLLSDIFLNYESVFIYIFLDGLIDINERECLKFKCPTNPFKITRIEVNSQLLEYVSYINYSLVLLKLLDNTRDAKNSAYKLLYAFFKRKKQFQLFENKYKINDKLCNLYDELYDLEINNSTDFDSCSRTMGLVLYEIVYKFFTYYKINVDEKVLNIAQHIGMWIYAIDAFDDFEIDLKNKSFNPLFSFSSDLITDEAQQKCLNSGEMMLGLMSTNILRLLNDLSIIRHKEIIVNIAKYGMSAELKKIKICRNKRNDKYNKRRNIK